MSADLEHVSLNTAVNSADSGDRALSANVRRLHNSLNLLLSDLEREQFIHCLNVYHAKRNVFDLVQTLKVILNTAGKRQLLPMLRLVIPRSDQLLFDQYTSEGLYLKSGSLPGNSSTKDFEDEGHSILQKYVCSISGQLTSGSTGGVCSAEELSAPFGEVRKVTLTRSRSHESLGFSIRGGSEHGVGIYVSLVEPGSLAEREGLGVGDQIMMVNNMMFDNVTHTEAVKVLKGCKKLAISVCSIGRVPGAYITNNMYSWVNPEGQTVSPPPDSQEANQREGYGMEERTVNLNMDEGRSLGLMIRGGAEYGLGIYITGVDSGSAADAGALKAGDQILEVNGQSFVTISHDEAVHILKTGRHLLMKVRDVGRLPHARTVPDETKWICSQAIAETSATPNPSSVINPTVNPSIHTCGSGSICNSRPSSAKATPVLGTPAGYRGVCPPGAQVSLEQQAYMLLTEPERQTMAYYLQEYQGGHIEVEPLAMALFELFNTHAKLSMLSEVRSLVVPQDLELYDRLVLHHEREAHKAWHGGLEVLHSQGHFNHSNKTNACVGARTGKDQEENTDAFQNIAPDKIQASGEFPRFFRAASFQTQCRQCSDQEVSQKTSVQHMPVGKSLLFAGPTRLFQACLHKPLKSLPTTNQPSPVRAHHTYTGASHHTSLDALHHSCQSFAHLSDSEHHNHPHFSYHTANHSQPSSGHYNCTCPVKLSCRSRSYEKASYLSKSASCSKAASPVPSPHPSPHLSPCPSPCPSILTPAAPPYSPVRPCSPAPNQSVVITDMNRLSADSRPQQRGASLSQLSDSGQTLSEDSGVDIAEAGGLSKDCSPRPSKNQLVHLEHPGVHVPLPGTEQLTGSPLSVPSATLVRVLKNANTIGMAIEGGANTHQPLPRIVTIQRGGSAHNCGQLKVGHVLLEVDGISLRGREHKDAAQTIAEAFKSKEDYIDLLVVEPGL